MNRLRPHPAKWLALAALGTGALFATGAHAGTSWSIGIGLPGVAIGVAEPVYYPPPAYVPPPVYYTPAPPPVYYRPPPPVYYRAPPVYYAPAPVYEDRGYRHRHWEHRGPRGHWRD